MLCTLPMPMLITTNGSDSASAPVRLNVGQTGSITGGLQRSPPRVIWPASRAAINPAATAPPTGGSQAAERAKAPR